MPEVGIGIARVTNPSAIKKLGGKDVLPTLGDIGFRNELHDRAFVIAGVTDATLLTDIRDSLTKAMDKGIPFEQWQREFKKTIEGRWLPTSKTGEPNTGWRARTIYHTNVRAAYGAARRKELLQMTDTHPFWKWRVGASKVHRPDHVMRDGMVLSADDPWWDEHFPPDGYGCNCYVQPVSRSAMERIGKADGEGSPVPDVPPPDHSKGAGAQRGASGMERAGASPGADIEHAPSAQPAPAQPEGAVRDGYPIKESELRKAAREVEKAEEEAKARAELPPTPVTPVRQKATDLGTAYSFPAMPESVQAHLRSLAQCFSTYAAKAWEKIGKTAVKLDFPGYKKWAEEIMDSGHHRGQTRVVGFFGKKVLKELKEQKMTIAGAAIEMLDEDILHIIRTIKREKWGVGVDRECVLGLMETLAKPKKILFDLQDPALLYIFDPPNSELTGKFVVKVGVECQTATPNHGKRRRVLNKVRTAGLVEETLLADPARYKEIK